uniref:Uncharacterized protein n=1 Tax=Coccidioides posadasii RMSCC 3488 TaxID=454284 RepID=A0A0J6FLQ5_COCPO|nr:hypothetical protein CPAG_07595 [Coccidioides posadasii RMSCC 3488]
MTKDNWEKHNSFDEWWSNRRYKWRLGSAPQIFRRRWPGNRNSWLPPTHGCLSENFAINETTNMAGSFGEITNIDRRTCARVAPMRIICAGLPRTRTMCASGSKYHNTSEPSGCAFLTLVITLRASLGRLG